MKSGTRGLQHPKYEYTQMKAEVWFIVMDSQWSRWGLLVFYNDNLSKYFKGIGSGTT